MTPQRTLTQQELLARDMSEGKLQCLIMGTGKEPGLAIIRGWIVRHARDSRGQNLNDVLDLLLIRPPRVVWMELKSQRGKVTWGQASMIDMLRDCHQEVHIIRPSDWLDGTVERILK